MNFEPFRASRGHIIIIIELILKKWILLKSCKDLKK
nr:MAG TPA: hypothetical protein [Bacteriophage sp.]